MLYSKRILVKWNQHNKRSFVKYGYVFTKYGDIFEVDPLNCPTSSRELIILKCDICGRPFERTILNYNQSKKKNLKIDACPDCQQTKAKMVVMNKYGVDNIFRKADYIKQCNMNKHNGLYHTQTNEFKEAYLLKDKNVSWKGGVSSSNGRRYDPKEKSWRREVYKKDNYTCQACGDNKGGNLNAHHILPYGLYEDERFNVDNGITLCQNCHIEFHKIYGVKNIGLKEIREYINSKCVTTTRDECSGGLKP